MLSSEVICMIWISQPEPIWRLCRVYYVLLIYSLFNSELSLSSVNTGGVQCKSRHIDIGYVSFEMHMNLENMIQALNQNWALGRAV